MAMAFDETAPFLADFGKPVVFGAIMGLGILDQPNRDINLAGIGVMATDFTLTFATADFPGLVEGENISVDGVGYQVREGPDQLDDGVFSRVMLKKR